MAPRQKHITTFISCISCLVSHVCHPFQSTSTSTPRAIWAAMLKVAAAARALPQRPSYKGMSNVMPCHCHFMLFSWEGKGQVGVWQAGSR